MTQKKNCFRSLKNCGTFHNKTSEDLVALTRWKRQLKPSTKQVVNNQFRFSRESDYFPKHFRRNCKDPIRKLDKKGQLKSFSKQFINSQFCFRKVYGDFQRHFDETWRFSKKRSGPSGNARRRKRQLLRSTKQVVNNQNRVLAFSSAEIRASAAVFFYSANSFQFYGSETDHFFQRA